MSSTTGLSSNRGNLAIDIRRDGRHRISTLDADGDGVVDGASLAGEKGKVTNVVGSGAQIQLNAARTETATGATRVLAERGLELTPRGIQSRDGFNARDTNANAALDFGGPPTLPENTTSTLRAGTTNGTTTTTAAVNGNINAVNATAGANRALRATNVSTRSPSELESRLDDYVSRTGSEDASLMWTALSTMAKTGIIDTKLASDIKALMQKGKVESKKNEIKATEEQIQAEREAAAMKLMFAIAAAVVQMGLAMAGPFGQAIGPALGQLINSLGEYINKTSGPQREADDKKIEIMRHQLMQEVFEQGIENAKSNYDEAREMLKLAIKILTEHAERQTQITTTITRT
ncbi:MAG TPA: hypothetical protein VLC93_02520 [Myxococcota bacterium]|nr:hypothetical protein [Myxococcota bacterium]